jgi:hypothetical protein
MYIAPFSGGFTPGYTLLALRAIERGEAACVPRSGNIM